MLTKKIPAATRAVGYISKIKVSNSGFGERSKNKIGLLLKYEIYSNWWLNYYGEEIPTQLAIVRNPHIFMEARIVNLVTEPTEADDMSDEEKERRKKIFKWFKYQNTGIVTDAFSTVPLALSTADFDGDHVQVTNSKEYINAVNRAIKAGNGNTVDLDIVGNQEEVQSIDVTDIKKLMEYDRLGFSNNIGNIINKVTVLWNIEQTKNNANTLMEYIEIADIIGQLTIDSAKTGEYEKFYEPIAEYISNKKIKTPYFKKYLQQYEEKVAKENQGLKNAEFFYPDDEELKEEQLEFSDSATNVNLICHDLEEAFEKIEQNVSEMKFDVNKFLSIFLTDEVQTRSNLYKRVKKKLQELAERNGKIFLNNKGDDDISNRYHLFYHYCKTSLLDECKLGDEKSLEKVVNIVIWLCYCDNDISSNNNAKTIIWNAFGDELFRRAIKKPLEKTTVKKHKISGSKNKLEPKGKKKLIKKKPSYPIDIKYLCFTKDMWEYIKSATKTYNDSRSLLNAVSKEETNCLRKLAIVIYVLSMGIRKDVIINGKRTVRKPSIILYASANGKMNKTLLAKICGFTDNQRKRMDYYLKRLAELRVIEIPKGKMSNLKIKMCYDDSCDFGENLIEDEVKKIKDLYVISSYLFNLKRL